MSFLLWPPASLLSSHHSSIRVFSLFCPVFCPFVGVICVTRLVSAVAVLFGHSLSLSFEEKDKVVHSSLFLAERLVPP